jgi:hypothetical protein
VHSSTVDHSQTFVLLLTSNYKNSIKPIWGKCFGDTGGVYTSSVAIKEAVIEQFGTKPRWEKIALPG